MHIVRNSTLTETWDFFLHILLQLLRGIIPGNSKPEISRHNSAAMIVWSGIVGVDCGHSSEGWWRFCTRCSIRLNGSDSIRWWMKCRTTSPSNRGTPHSLMVFLHSHIVMLDTYKLRLYVPKSVRPTSVKYSARDGQKGPKDTDVFARRWSVCFLANHNSAVSFKFSLICCKITVDVNWCILDLCCHQ